MSLNPSSSQWDRSADGRLGAPADYPGYFHQHLLASFPFRAMAGVIDWGVVFFLPFWACMHLSESAAWLVAGGLAVFNSAYLPSRTTQSLGKRILGIRMVWVKRGYDNEFYVCFVPFWVAVLRLALHYVDFLPCGLGFLLPIVNLSKGCFSDYVVKSVHFRDPRLPVPERSVVGVNDWI